MRYFKLPIKIKLMLSLFLIGLVIGIVTANQTNLTIPILEYNELSKIRIFINTFTMNIWNLFVVWCLGFNIVGIIFILIIVFLKGYIEGISLLWIFKLSSTLTTINVVSLLIYWLIMIPLFFWLVNKMTKIKEQYLKKDEEKSKIMIIVLIVNAIYSLIISLIN